MKLKKDAEQSLYMQLMFEIKAQIESGYYVAGDKIPTEVECASLKAFQKPVRVPMLRHSHIFWKQRLLLPIKERGSF